MWRYLAGGAAGLLFVAAGLFLFGGRATTEPARLPPPPQVATAPAEPLPAEAPAATRDREQKRFDRYDKDHDERIAREEYLASRRKAFARLDADGDGRLAFDEWAARTTAKFAAADKDKSGTLTRAEFATTAVKRRPAPQCRCPQPAEDAD